MTDSDEQIGPAIAPNRRWCESVEDSAVKLEFPDETYVVSVQCVTDSEADDDEEAFSFDIGNGDAP